MNVLREPIGVHTTATTMWVHIHALVTLDSVSMQMDMDAMV